MYGSRVSAVRAVLPIRRVLHKLRGATLGLPRGSSRAATPILPASSCSMNGASTWRYSTRSTG